MAYNTVGLFARSAPDHSL